nr:glycosyltransferase [uncultured Cellulosilyticum sp.]
MLPSKMRHDIGFSIITATKRKHCVSQVIENYKRQTYPNKELIIIINNDNMSVDDFAEACKEDPNIAVYQLPEDVTTGECLNYGCARAKNTYLAKFDDDDYYGKYYLQEVKDTFEATSADIVCKRGIFYYLEKEEELIVRFRMTRQCKKVIGGAGSTLCFPRELFQEIQFSELKRASDSDFIRKCKEKDKNIYTSTSYNFCSIRSKDLEQHTWNISNEELKEKADKNFGAKHMTKEEMYSFIERYPV